jgi:cytochrome P450
LKALREATAQPDDLQRLERQEALRWASPINHVLRRTTADATLAETEVPAGSLVSRLGRIGKPGWGGVLGTVQVHPRPFPNQHLAFGLGVHRCIGQHVAIAGMKTFFDLWRENVRYVSLAGKPRYLVSNFLNGVVSLPLEVSWK